MRSTLLFSCGILLLTHGQANAQLLAGEVPDGLSAMELEATITLTQAFTADSIALEFDCDDFQDAWAVLYRGAPEVDAPNYAQLNFLDEDIEVCADLTAPFQVRPKYHQFGEPLDCAGGFEWQIATPLELGDFGSLLPTGPNSIDSMYIAYRRDGQTGWMLLSFDLQSNTGVSLTVHRLLPICPVPTSVDETSAADGITLYPNPCHGETIRVESTAALRSIQVLDATGRSISHYDGMVQTIPSPAKAGSYFVRALHADGRISVLRLISY